MQKDFHYYATYCIARAAGLNCDSARTIAYSAQFVDDNTASDVEEHEDGSSIHPVTTAHHPSNISNRNTKDQRLVWIPFHFIPAGKGDSWTEKLITHKDSEIARKMIRNHRNQYNSEYTLHLMGIASHAYADTFSHYGFSGVSSRKNRVDGSSIKMESKDDVLFLALGKTFSDWVNKYGGLTQNIRAALSGLAEKYTGALGHGGVSTYPDFPFLKWSFKYENSDIENIRDNPATYLEYAQKIHEIFSLYATENPQFCGRGSSHIKWNLLEKKIDWIINQEGGLEDRINIWQAAAQDGDFSASEKIPEYDENDWHQEADSLKDLDSSDDAKDLDVYKFFCAAEYHRFYILRVLLPSHGIVVI